MKLFPAPVSGAVLFHELSERGGHRQKYPSPDDLYIEPGPREVLIPLTKGYTTIVDAIDAPVLQRFSWQAHITPSGKVYASCKDTRCVNGTRKRNYMHRKILGLDAVFGIVADHLDGNSLNNRRSNLRVCTQQINCLNMDTGGQVKYRGVFKGKPTTNGEDRFEARIRIRISGSTGSGHLGTFKNSEDAARAYDDALVEVLGEVDPLIVLRLLNFPRRHSYLLAMGIQEAVDATTTALDDIPF